MRRIGFWMAMMAVCVLVSAGGCGKQAKHEKAGKAETKAEAKEIKAAKKHAGPTVNLMLTFKSGDTSDYKVVTESVKDYKFEQPSINQTKVQQTLNRTEVLFNQKIVSVEPSGDAKALITIEDVKYLSKTPTGTAADFDSGREADKKGAIGSLIGQTYVIKLSPAGEVAGIEDVQKARTAVAGDSMEQKVAQAIVSDEMIKQRHAVVALPAAKESTVAVDANWSKVKGSPAGMLQPKSYEQIYTLKEVKDDNGQKVAVIDMDSRPSSAKAPPSSGEEAKGMSFFSKMFDNKETYTGKMMLDLTTGKVNSYNEKLKSEWTAVEPVEEQKSDKGPDVLTMGFTYSYDIEKVK